MHICDYGCGQEGKYHFKNGKWCCSKTTTKCPSIRKINSLKNKGRVKTEEERLNISKSKKGKNRYFTKEWRKNLSESLKGRSVWNKGLTKETDKRVAKQASYGMQGKKHTEDWKLQQSEKMKGFKHSEETKRIISEGRINRNISKGKNNPMFGKTHKNKSKLLMRQKKKDLYNGENNPNWHGGVSKDPYCFEFTDELKEYIKERDNNTCQNPHCRNSCETLCVHHIDYDKKHCDSCNSRANFNREYWKKIYSKILKER